MTTLLPVYQLLLRDINESLDRNPDSQFELLKFAAGIAEAIPLGVLENVANVAEFYIKLSSNPEFEPKKDAYLAAFLEIVRTDLNFLETYKRDLEITEDQLLECRKELRFANLVVQICNELSADGFDQFKEVLRSQLAPTNPKNIKSKIQLFTRLFCDTVLNENNLESWMKQIPLERIVCLIQKYTNPTLEVNEEVEKVKEDQQLDSDIAKPVELGRGAFGVVYKMQIGDKMCAAKCFHQNVTALDKKFVTKFKKEAELLPQFEHPNIVKYIGSLSRPDCKDYHLVMELMHCSLHDILKSDRPMKTDLLILLDVAKGLLYLHSRSPAIIHRDLTASNVLLTDDDPPVAKIADFGNCRIIDAETSSQSSFRFMTAKPGTPNYMPPEADSKEYTEKLDIFSFGHLSLTTFIGREAVSLQPAQYFEGDDDHDQHRILSEVVRREAYFKDLAASDSVVELIKECLHNRPRKRPSADALVTRLEELIAC